MDILIAILPLVIGWCLDLLFGDPACLPHPIIWFGRMIGFCERAFNGGEHRVLKGGLVAVVLILMAFILTWILMDLVSVSVWLSVAVQSVLIFYCLAGTTIVKEVGMVFKAVDRSLEEGRMQVGRIVGRDTAGLSAHEIRTAALETLAENLSDGVIAPLFWYAILGLPGMVAYKMINTLDSMIGYKNDRFRHFGYIAAKIDDVANFIPARLTAFLMVMVSGKISLLSFIRNYGREHASPNSGYPEAALAGILNCRFGGTHDYFGKSVYKPYIGENARDFDYSDAVKAIAVNRKVEVIMILITVGVRLLFLL